ncbi:hypothetical protein Cgig2_015388 [Carnegiea gigantea]|uniref:Reverse transcriptase n=1 Tax=Carnegiea gigantea TaxID=171969 RepID=A0A9Q1JSH2_9CARY|nr:hypothetical protein Cgig2_015388 [Carnegiea gigantea]
MERGSGVARGEKLFNAFRNNKNANKAKQSLTFTNSSYLATGAILHPDDRIGGSGVLVAQEAMDEDTIISMSNEFFKRKLHNFLVDQEREKFGAVETHVTDHQCSDSKMAEVTITLPTTMTILCINYRGLGKPQAVRDRSRMFDEFDSVFVDSRGRASGLGLIRRKEGLEWRFSRVYNFSNSYNQLKTCDLMLDLSTRSSLLWLVGGDLNEILFNFEKKGGSLKSRSVLEAFQATLEQCGLHDLDYQQGHDFIWWNGQDGCDFVEARLDRYCANPDWTALFPAARVMHIDDDFSDHLPMLLHCFEEKRWRQEQRRRRFENMWALDARCEGVINDAWACPIAGSMAQRCLSKIDVCMDYLAAWNVSTFGNVQKEIRRRTDQLKCTIEIQHQKALLNKIRE